MFRSVRHLRLKYLILIAIFVILCLLLVHHLNYSSTTSFSDVGQPHALLTVLILSGSANTAQRQVIRQTWASRLGRFDSDQIRTYFAVGIDDLSMEQRRTLLIENSVFNDMLLLSGATDGYSGLSRRVKVALQWLHNAASFTYLLKVDDDSFVRLPELMEYLQKLGRIDRLYLGFFRGSATVQRHGKWAEHDWFLCQHYLPHARGGGYLLTHDLVAFIVKNIDWLTEYANEDVSVGTWLAPLEILRMHEPLFDVEYRSRGCNNKYLVAHKIPLGEMRTRVKNLKRTGKMCTVEKASYPSYRYNWSANPLDCCVRSWLVP